LESLVADGIVGDPDGLARVLETSLAKRMATSDLVSLIATHRAMSSGDLDLVTAIDRTLTATKLGSEERQGSERTGRRLLIEVGRMLGETNPHPAREYCLQVEGGCAPGNWAVAFGIGAWSLEIEAPHAALAACHSFTSGLLGAAMRCMKLGHGDAQRLLREAQPTMVAAVTEAQRVPWPQMFSGAPHLDIATGRHQQLEARMFAS
jgi:urease accessory protein